MGGLKPAIFYRRYRYPGINTGAPHLLPQIPVPRLGFFYFNT